jgi:hypothetical protein
MATPHLPRMPPGATRPEEYSEGERRNLAVVREYMETAYTPGKASADAVRHLVAAGASFEAHTTFPHVHDPLQYAQERGGTCRTRARSRRQRVAHPWARLRAAQARRRCMPARITLLARRPAGVTCQRTS